ncbi:MAG: Sterol-binding domain protein [Gammaproteobacteria bacterium]|nr:Sterol-binding domain protein [Gammaproteobacteria bacterium]
MSNIITSIAEELSNRLLRLDPDTLDRFADLDGKVVCIHLKDSSLKMFIRPFGGGFRITEKWDGEVDVTLTGSVFAFAKLATREGDTDLFFKREILIEGDTDLGQRFRRILERLDIDWEEVASRCVGDVAAHQMGKLTRDMRHWASDTTDTLGKDFAEYFQEEQRELAKKEPVEAFMRAVDVLRADADRLQKRIERLQEKISL